jgi:hypothetical protein
MNAGRPVWLDKPTTRHIVLLSLLFFTGLGLSIFTMVSNEGGFFQSENMLLLFLQISACFIYFKVLFTYLKNKKQPM